MINSTLQMVLQRLRFPRVRNLRLLIVTLIAMLAIFSASVAIGQAAQDFDLACRSAMTGGGGTFTGGAYGLTSALGLPIVPSRDSDTAPTYTIRAGSYALRAGFLPGYPVPTTAATLTEAAAPAQLDFVQRFPIIFKVARIVRGGC